MADRFCKEHRSWLMSRVRGRDTGPERIVRSMLHRLGFRYRLHDPGLPGRPDLVLPKYRAVVFVHGCFWHRHRGCRRAATPKTNTQFWRRKFQKNRMRDERNRRKLSALGWKVVLIWECQVYADPHRAVGDAVTSIMGH